MILRKILELFVEDSAERRKYIEDFNRKAKEYFVESSIDVLYHSESCAGNDDNSYRHALSAPKFASGFELQIRGGAPLSTDDVLALGRAILLNQFAVRKLYVLHWDTLIIRDITTGYFVDWRIKDFINISGLAMPILKL